jgi:hypothetical protein
MLVVDARGCSRSPLMLTNAGRDQARSRPCIVPPKPDQERRISVLRASREGPLQKGLQVRPRGAYLGEGGGQHLTSFHGRQTQAATHLYDSGRARDRGCPQ